MDLAYMFRRGLAYLLDSLLMFGFFVLTQRVLFLPLRRLLFGADEWFASGVKTELYTLLTISLPIWLYFALTEVSAWQATPGKFLLGLQTVDAASRGPLTLPQSLLRTIIKMVPWEVAHLANNLPVPMRYDPNPGFRLGFLASPLLLILYAALALWTARHRSLHDLLAKTIVVARK
ncbi:MAG: RDD family protein [Chloroflexia bacterium]|nr:RDD family protein [Chloroflexia bacterium]